MAGIVKDDRQRFEQEIARKEKTIQELRTIIRSNEERIEKLEDDKKAQKEKIKALEAENKELRDKIKALKEEIDKLKNENESLVKKLEARIDKLEKDSSNQKSLLIIIQIGTTIQRNICKYVLGNHFKENKFYKVKCMEEYIAELTEPAEKKSAEERWSELKHNKNIWNESLVESLKKLNQRRIGIAHPKLTSENIQQAMECLKEDPEFDLGMLENICKLKKNWETTESLLRKPEPESNEHDEKQVRGAEGVEKGKYRRPNGMRYDT